MGVVIFIIAVFVVIMFLAAKAESDKVAAMTPDERTAYARQKAMNNAIRIHGQANPAMVCPHCQVKGQVHTKAVTQKKGVSGAKATGALLTGGVSLLATGLSRKENHTEVFCRNCRNTWWI